MQPLRVLIIILHLGIFPSLSHANPVRDKYNEAMNAFLAKDYQKSIGLFEETLKLNSNFAQPYNFIAMAKKELGAQDEDVVALLEKSIQLDPNYSLAHDNLGKMYYGMARFDEAKEQAQKAVVLDPGLITARLSLAWICLLGFGETREAIEHFETAMAQQRTDYGQFGLGLAYFMDHQRAKVLEMITNLRLEGNEKLAKELEDMIRQGRYLPPNGIQSLISPQSHQKESGEMAKDKPVTASIPDINYPVRLSGKLDQNSASLGQPTNGNEPSATTGVDRIQQLQRNYKPSNTNY